ncbi:prevent-host-death family protein [Terriglobus roseus DSM 18391]|uniref:Antitoxin n=1 Tax=Terriglobus roseus (strain DSM 18391 / NRRL B-41598 / KBS 63) TaxID=926566 RepID=I3ZBI9_TERRK|nr:type II toxin-antitoxin system Phd/YefM family antitoxin [Terriglobus roseus]AFL86607.1 prevent-host-death family protein [Terriglobus roseus DSM 18391]
MPPRIKLSEDIQPLTTFRNNSAEMLRQMKKTKRAVVLTVSGRPQAVIQTIEDYERLLDLASEASEEEGLRQALDDLKNGRTRPAEEVFKEIRQRHGFSDRTDSARRA